MYCLTFVIVGILIIYVTSVKSKNLGISVLGKWIKIIITKKRST